MNHTCVLFRHLQFQSINTYHDNVIFYSILFDASIVIHLNHPRETSTKQPIFSMTSGEGQICLPNFLISRMPSSNFCWSPPSALICPGLQRTITKSKFLQSSKNLHTVHANSGRPYLTHVANAEIISPFPCMIPAKNAGQIFLIVNVLPSALEQIPWALDFLDFA